MHNVKEKWKELHAQRKSKMDGGATTKQKKETPPVTTSISRLPCKELISMQRTYAKNSCLCKEHEKENKSKDQEKGPSHETFKLSAHQSPNGRGYLILRGSWLGLMVVFER